MKQNKPLNETSENEIETAIVKYVEDRKGLALKLEVPSIRGYPDRLVLLDGLIFFIEVKKPKGGVVSPHQDRIIADLQARGYNATVVRTFEEFVAYVGTVKNLSR